MSDFSGLGFQEHGSGGGDQFASLGFAPHGSDNSVQEQERSWLDTQIPGGTPRGYIKGALNALPTVGMIAGGIAGAETGPGAIATAGLGSAAGESLKNIGEQYLLGENKTRSDIYGGPVKAAMEGSTAEMGGQLIGKGLETAANTSAGKYIINKASAIPEWAAKKIGRVFADVPEETTARYIDNPSAINNAPSREQISDQILNLKTNAEDQLSKAQEELVNAKGDAADKKQAYKEALKNTNLTSMTSSVHDAIGNLKDQVIKGSGEAYGILSNADGKVKTEPLLKIIQDNINSLHVNGVAKSPSAAQAINELQAYQQSLEKMGTKKIPGPVGTWSIDNSLSMPEAKQVLQGLDKTINWKRSVGSFAPETDQALSGLRTAIDQDVKGQVPEYASKMADVSRQSRLLNAASENFGTPEKAISNLNNLDSQKGSAVHLPIIEALGKETGQDLSAPVNDFLAKQKILSTPSLFEKLINETPEVKRVSSAQSSLETAKDNASIFKGVTPQSITAKTKSLGGANNYGAEATLEPIDQFHGTNFKKQIQARNDLDQFSKDTTNGSRKAIIGKALGTTIGAVVGGKEGAILGYGAGTAAGAAADKYAGRAFKYGLDKGIASKSIPASIIPKSPSLIGQGASNMMTNVLQPLSKAASNDQQTGPEKWANDGFHNMKGHVNENDREFLEKHQDAMMIDPKAKELLITASHYEPGSKPLDDVLKHLKKKFGEK